MAKRITVITLSLITFILALFCIGIIYNFISLKLDAIRYPAPGRLVDIGGYKLHIDCSGNGGPSVILDAGGGLFSSEWVFVQSHIAQFTKVCSYDRAGTGWSEESPLPRSIENIVKELHELLQRAGVQPPYILVGHSLGGINMRMYADTYPDEVFGLVLVDSSHELQYKKLQKSGIKWEFSESFAKKILRWISNTYVGYLIGITRLYEPWADKDFYASVPESIRGAFIARSVLRSSLDTMKNEGKHGEENFKHMEEAKNLIDGKPLIVITAGKATDENTPAYMCQPLIEFYEKIHFGLQKDLVTKSTRGKQVFAEKSCHMIPFCQPEIIVEAVKEMVDEYNKAFDEKQKHKAR